MPFSVSLLVWVTVLQQTSVQKIWLLNIISSSSLPIHFGEYIVQQVVVVFVKWYLLYYIYYWNLIWKQFVPCSRDEVTFVSCILQFEKNGDGDFSRILMPFSFESNLCYWWMSVKLLIMWLVVAELECLSLEWPLCASLCISESPLASHYWSSPFEFVNFSLLHAQCELKFVCKAFCYHWSVFDWLKYNLLSLVLMFCINIYL